MTELDKLKRAKAYLEKLADGVNPLDNSLDATRSTCCW